MAVLAGETIIAGKVPGERIATTIRTVTSDPVTGSATVIDTVVAPVAAGRTYAVIWNLRLNADTAGNDAGIAIREDGLAGNLIEDIIVDIPVVNRYNRTFLYGEYTADVTEDKTFVGTLNFSSGSGNVTVNASAGRRTFLYVDYIRG